MANITKNARLHPNQIICVKFQDIFWTESINEDQHMKCTITVNDVKISWITSKSKVEKFIQNAEVIKGWSGVVMGKTKVLSAKEILIEQPGLQLYSPDSISPISLKEDKLGSPLNEKPQNLIPEKPIIKPIKPAPKRVKPI